MSKRAPPLNPLKRSRPSITAAPNIVQTMADPLLFKPWFKDSATWQAWRTFLTALFALPMDEQQAAIFRQHTGRETLPLTAATEAWLIAGRRAGKSFIMAIVAVYLACFRDYQEYLQPGERATVLVLAADRKQARVILRYISGLLESIPMLAAMIERVTAEAFDLNNAVTIEVGTASFRTTRGYTFAAVLADEIAFWRTDDAAANPDTEILTAIRPGLSNIPQSLLLCASSPYGKRGELWNAYQRWYGKPDAPLVWRAGTRDMNPGFRQSIIDNALETDRASAAAEYLASFRDDVSGWASRETIEAAVDRGVLFRPPVPGRRYFCAADASGGVRDSFTGAVAHNENGTPTLDCLIEIRAPFNPDVATAQVAEAFQQYGCRSTVADKYAAQWVVQAFAKNGIELKHSERDRSAIYLDVLPLFTTGRVRLLDHPRLIGQFASLERRTSPAGKDRVDHGPGGMDDACNSAASALVQAAEEVDDPATGVRIDVETFRRPNPFPFTPITLGDYH